jgi:capsular polysaccharide biosynthesis protein
MNTDNTDVSEEEQDEKTGVTLGDIWHMIVKHWIALVIFFVVGLIGGGVYAFGVEKPVWTSTGTVIVIADSNSQTTTSDTISTTDFNNSFNYVITARDTINDTPIMTAVMTSINTSKGTSYTLKEIKKMVSASARTYTSLEKSLYVDITANTADKDLSQALVDTTITETLSITASDSRYAFLKNRLALTSSSSTPVDTSFSKAKVLLIAGACGLIAGILYGILFELCSTKVGNVKDIEALTGEKVIGLIPMQENTTEEAK